MSGLLGVRTSTTSTEMPDGTQVEVHYGRITRPGLATPWSVTVHRDGGFSGPIVVRSTSAYFDLFDENGLDPDPAAATQDGEMVIWEFDPPPGDTFRLSFDARIEPAAQWGRGATTEVEVRARSPRSPTTRGCCPDGARRPDRRRLRPAVGADARDGQA